MKKTRRRKLTSEEMEQLRKLWSQGLTISEIAEKIESSQGCVSNHFTSFNKGFNSFTEYQNFLNIEAGATRDYEQYSKNKNFQQRFEHSVSQYHLLKLYSGTGQQKEKDYRVVHFYEIDSHELIPKLLEELGKAKGGDRLVEVIDKHYFQSQSLKSIANEQGLKSRWAIGLRNKKALKKLREIAQRTEFSTMF